MVTTYPVTSVIKLSFLEERVALAIVWKKTNVASVPKSKPVYKHIRPFSLRAHSFI